MLDRIDKTRIVIVDDHPLVIEGFKNVIQGDPALELVGEFRNAEHFLKFTEMPDMALVDLVLLDITLPDQSGIQVCKEIKKRGLEVVVLAISNHSETSIIRQMLQSGASGYLLKTADAEDILDCIGQALQGRLVLSSEVKSQFDLAQLKKPAEVPELTKREKQILELLAEGKKSAEIAAQLFISPLTVKTHRATLLQKFQTGSFVVAISKAREYGILL